MNPQDRTEPLAESSSLVAISDRPGEVRSKTDSETATGIQSPPDSEADIRLARSSDGHVLISASPERALAVAKRIGTDATRAGAVARLEVCDVALGQDVLTAVAQTAGANRPSILLLREVHTLSAGQQCALKRLLIGPRARASRLVASSSVSLFDRVREGAFDADLFYCLNTIHIVMS
jgi:hypothetical protein